MSEKTLSIGFLLSMIIFGLWLQKPWQKWRGWSAFFSCLKRLKQDIHRRFIRAKTRDKAATIVFILACVVGLVPDLQHIGYLLYAVFCLIFMYSIAKRDQEGE